MPRRRMKKTASASPTMAFVAEKKKRREANAGKKKRAIPAGRKTVAAAKEEAQERLDADRWEGAAAHHFVGLYAVLFEYVYGVALDIKGNDWRGACSAARGMMKREFNDDRRRMLAYVRWVWSREREREQWRRENEKSGAVIGWRLMFSSTKLLTEFKVHIARKQGD